MGEAIDYFAYDNKLISLKTHFSIKARKKMFDRFMKDVRPEESDQCIDIGATPDTKLADSNLFDKMYPYKQNLTICSIEDCSNIANDLGLQRFVFNESGKPLPFSDNEFDTCFCSAVLEHVGDRKSQEFFINECLRVSKKVFLTTPYRYFPLEMHTFLPFLHWLPWSMFQKIVRKTKGDFWADINNLNLCAKKDIKNMHLSSRVEIKFVRTLGLKSNMIIEKV
jgi:hypothetical protein